MAEITTTDYVNVADQARSLGCNAPTGLAILPRNFDSASDQSQLVHEESAATVRKLWRKAGIDETALERPGTEYPPIRERDFLGWAGPIIFVSYSVLSGNEYQLSVALGVVSNYLTEFFKGIGDSNNADLDIVTETKHGDYRRVKYRGSVSGLTELPAIIREVADNER